MKVPDTPLKLGFSSKFHTWRPYQREILEKLVENLPNKDILWESPTGYGKSLNGIALSVLLGEKIIYLVSTKQLQRQLETDFPHIAVIKGRENYPCIKYPEGDAEDCDHSEEEKCSWTSSCPYLMAKKKALVSNVACLNYSYFLHEANYVGQFSGRPIIVCDEVDLLEHHLLNFIDFSITSKQRAKYGEPEYKTKWESWRLWAEGLLEEFITEEARLTEEGIRTRKHQLYRRSLRRQISKLRRFLQLVDDTWVMTEDEEGNITFKPVWVSKYANYFFWRHGKRFLGMSATILSSYEMGKTIGKVDWVFYQYPSIFPKEIRPVFYYPVARLSQETEEMEFPKIARFLTNVILPKYPNYKGLVHTVSYSRTERLLSIAPSQRYFVPSKENIEEDLEFFKKSKSPLVLVSPRFERGLDLPYDAARFCVVSKVLYPDLGDKQVSRRLYGSRDGHKWYAWETARRIIQALGRATRAIDDWSHGIILDAEFERFLNANKFLFPDWWLEALQEKRL